MEILGKRIFLLHCVSQYPCEKKNANIKRMLTLKNEFKVNVGYSDHTTGTKACFLAIMLGAQMIEKHFTINKKLKGLDHKISADQEDLKSIVEFGNTDVKEIMKSRVAISAIDKTTSFTDVLNIILSSGYSRIPVFEDEIDKVVGVLYIKDLIPHLNAKDNFDWVKLCRPAYFVPENKMINDLLKQFQAKKNHLAIVVDEYGGTSGLVTLEDIIETVFGLEIVDESDTVVDLQVLARQKGNKVKK